MHTHTHAHTHTHTHSHTRTHTHAHGRVHVHNYTLRVEATHDTQFVLLSNESPRFHTHEAQNTNSESKTTPPPTHARMHACTTTKGEVWIWAIQHHM